MIAESPAQDDRDFSFAIPLFADDLLHPAIRDELEAILADEARARASGQSGLDGALRGIGLDLFVFSPEHTIAAHPVFAIVDNADGRCRRMGLDWVPDDPSRRPATRALWARIAALMAKVDDIPATLEGWPLPWNRPSRGQMFAHGPSAAEGSGYLSALFLSGGITLLSQEMPATVTEHYGTMLLDPGCPPEQATALAVVGIRGSSTAHGRVAARRGFEAALPGIEAAWGCLFGGEAMPALKAGPTITP